MSKVCKWTQEFDPRSYDTSCGRSFYLTDGEGTPKENEYNFCPGCGGELEEVELHSCYWCNSWNNGKCLEKPGTCDKQELNGEG